MQFTQEDYQRFARIVLQWSAGALTMYGLIDKDASWVEPVISAAITFGSLAWTLYSTRPQAKITEVAKLPVVESITVHSVAVATAAPVNVVPSLTATFTEE